MTRYMPEPRGDIKRLPKWAQEHIGYLEGAVNGAEAELVRVSSQHPGSNLQLNGKVGYPSVSLPDSATIKYYLGDSREEYRDLIEVHHNRNPASNDPNSLEVTAYGGGIIVRPRVSNGVSLSIDSRMPS